MSSYNINLPACNTVLIHSPTTWPFSRNKNGSENEMKKISIQDLNHLVYKDCPASVT